MVKGKIVLVAFPFDDFSEEKIRPVLCSLMVYNF